METGRIFRNLEFPIRLLMATLPRTIKLSPGTLSAAR